MPKEGGARFFRHIRFEDERGWLTNINQRDFVADTCKKFVHSFISFSTMNTLRGFHFQSSPQAQEKIIHVIDGEILDVAFCLDQEGSTPKCVSAKLGASYEFDSVWLASNMAHGFLVLSRSATLLYLNSAPYDSNNAHVIYPRDPSINFDWGLNEQKPIMSRRDNEGMSWHEYKERFQNV